MRANLNGYIVSDEVAPIYRRFGYTVVSPADVRKAIEDNPAGEVLTLEVNSPGGSMFSAFEMYSVLRGAPCRVEAEIQSLAASAASTVVLGCSVVRATPVAQMMIHLPATVTYGDRPAHLRTAEALGSFTESILNAYALKASGRKTRDELRSMMERESWLSVQEAVDAGLVDEVLYDEGGVLAAGVVNSVGAGFHALLNSGGLPPIEQLRALESAPPPADPEPGADAPPNTDASDRAERLLAALTLKKFI